MCASLIYLADIEKIYYAVPGEKINSLKSRGSDFRELVAPGIGRQVLTIPILSSDAGK
jgi:hypothetical protein